jgi:hypothetical protein
MSELTSCNYCDLLQIKSRAKAEGKIVVLRPAKKEDEYYIGGTDCIVIDKDGKENKAAWFMEISNHCVC